ncbi:hypothetical protein GCM10010298_53370 [Streptomyces microflavus]|nr:hypothetical protein GCM10010298_53370 [Streptomyces microflavus]
MRSSLSQGFSSLWRPHRLPLTLPNRAESKTAPPGGGRLQDVPLTNRRPDVTVYRAETWEPSDPLALGSVLCLLVVTPARHPAPQRKGRWERAGGTGCGWPRCYRAGTPAPHGLLR